LKINVYTHILPEKYKEGLEKRGVLVFQDQLNARAPSLWDLDQRFRFLDNFEGLREILTVVQPPIESLVDRNGAIQLAQIANDGMAELVNKYPNRFAGAVACLPLNDIDAALKETERAIQELGFKGIQIFSSVNGKPLDSPEFMSLYALMVKYDLPIWLHPNREANIADYTGETQSRYQLYSGLGWPYETTLAMARLVYSGLFDKLPEIKFITHHCGAMVPYFAHRLYELPRPGLKKPPTPVDFDDGKLSGIVEYFKMFYGDTALKGNAAALLCGHSFFGTDHVLFGTDAPFGGIRALTANIKAVESLGLPAISLEKIFSANARKLLRLR
jgi:uncharacterized protein